MHRHSGARSNRLGVLVRHRGRKCELLRPFAFRQGRRHAVRSNTIGAGRRLAGRAHGLLVDGLLPVVVVAERVLFVPFHAHREGVPHRRPLDRRGFHGAPEEERRGRPHIDRLAVHVRRLARLDLDLELGLAELRHQEAVSRHGVEDALLRALHLQADGVVPNGCVARQFERPRERPEAIRRHILAAHFLPARVPDHELQRWTGCRDAVLRVVVRAHYALVLDLLARPVDGPIRVHLSHPLSGVVLRGKVQLVGRAPLLPARAREPAVATAFHHQVIRAVDVLSQRRCRDFERGQPVRVRRRPGRP